MPNNRSENWLVRMATQSGSDGDRIEQNIDRLQRLSAKVIHLAKLVTMAPPVAHSLLQELLATKIVSGRPVVHSKLSEALGGENRQKMAMDSPHRFREIMNEADGLVQAEIVKERRKYYEATGKKLELPGDETETRSFIMF